MHNLFSILFVLVILAVVWFIATHQKGKFKEAESDPMHSFTVISYASPVARYGDRVHYYGYTAEEQAEYDAMTSEELESHAAAFALDTLHADAGSVTATTQFAVLYAGHSFYFRATFQDGKAIGVIKDDRPHTGFV